MASTKAMGNTGALNTKDAESRPTEMYGIWRETHAWRVVLKRGGVKFLKQSSFRVHQGEEGRQTPQGLSEGR